MKKPEEFLTTVDEMKKINEATETISFNERIAKTLEVNLDTATDVIKTGDNKEIEVD